MLKKALVVAVVAGSAVAVAAAPASAAATVCYDVTVVANGETVVDEAGCVQA